MIDGTPVSTPVRFAGDGAPGAPRVLAVAMPPSPGGHEAERTRARRLARDALGHALAQALGCAAHDIALSDERGTVPRAAWRVGPAPELARRLEALHLSISHAAGLSLVAWCEAGPVGVDLQAMDESTFGAAPERARLAALYWGQHVESNQAPALDTQAFFAIDLISFSQHWTAHEARLKCLGEPLQEWSPALQRRLDACTTRPLALADVAPGWAGALAWLT